MFVFALASRDFSARAHCNLVSVAKRPAFTRSPSRKPPGSVGVPYCPYPMACFGALCPAAAGESGRAAAVFTSERTAGRKGLLVCFFYCLLRRTSFTAPLAARRGTIVQFLTFCANVAHLLGSLPAVSLEDEFMGSSAAAPKFIALLLRGNL
uniref:Transmembrane protein n=1 Tax=Steinernema glaseri TaxID=37863 RepID=A0A1I7YNW0_9BILA